jgi:hypothetical protein
MLQFDIVYEGKEIYIGRNKVGTIGKTTKKKEKEKKQNFEWVTEKRSRGEKEKK